MNGPATEALERAMKRRRITDSPGPCTCNHTATDRQSWNTAQTIRRDLDPNEQNAFTPITCSGSTRKESTTTTSKAQLSSHPDISSANVQSRIIDSSFTFDDTFHVLSGIDNENYERFPTIEWKFASASDLQHCDQIHCQKDSGVTSTSTNICIAQFDAATVDVESSSKSSPRPLQDMCSVDVKIEKTGELNTGAS